MKSVFLSLAILASAVAAQTTTASAASAGSSTACDADYIVETCLEGETAKFQDCGDNDWNCKCAAQQAILTCYNNCPNDPRKTQAEGQQSIFCGYATQFPSATKAIVSAASSAYSASSTSASGSATSSAAGAAKTNSAADVALNAGGVLAAVAGAVAALL